MLKKIAAGLAGLLAILVLVIATRPAHFQVERSATMAAPPSAPFGLVNDFHQWSRWSPWEKLDPSLKKDYLGAGSGVGAEYHWSGGGDVGEGRMTLTESRPTQAIIIRLEFIRPFAAVNTTTFNFSAVGDGTKVTWRMDGENGFMAKAFGLFMDMDTMVGGDFEKGLAAMKADVEAASASDAGV